MSSRRAQYLAELGIPVYRLRTAPAAGEAGEAATQPDFAADPAPGVQVSGARARGQNPAVASGSDWELLAREVAQCTRCELHGSRTQTVFGIGARDAPLMVVGEAPGAEEDRQGEPFVGPAGQLLNAMLAAIGFGRAEVYIANILKCRPPRNRDPRPEEAAACMAYLERQIALVRPRALLAVGRIAAQGLLRSEVSIGRLRGQVYRYGQSATPLVVTYHPAYLLRSPIAKAKAWDDLCIVKELLVEL